MKKAIFSTNPITGKEYFHEFREVGEEKTWKQWIADVYHCSECWGQKMTDEEMLIDLTESAKQKDHDDYSPDPSLYRECAAYWNQLCEDYPN